MTWTNFVVNLILAWVLLFINGKLGKWKQYTFDFFSYSSFEFGDINKEKFSDNLFQLLIHPAIYLALVGSILQAFSCETIVRSLWLLVPLYWILRFAVMAFRDMFFFQNWPLQIALLFVSLLLSEGTYFLMMRLLGGGNVIFIDLEQFRDAFWFAAFGFVVKFVWDFLKRWMVGEVVFPPSKKAAIIVRRYNRYYRKYNKTINSSIERACVFKSLKQRDHFVCLVYAIMIFEAHNRPLWMRLVEYVVKCVFPNRLMSLGIMQIQTRQWISNKGSILLAVRKLHKAFSTAETSSAIEEAIYDYNPDADYVNEVTAIYNEITNFLGLTQYGWQIVKVIKRSKLYK